MKSQQAAKEAVRPKIECKLVRVSGNALIEYGDKWQRVETSLAELVEQGWSIQHSTGMPDASIVYTMFRASALTEAKSPGMSVT